MARFVIANRRAGKFHESEKRAARVAMDHAVATIASAITIVGDNQPAQDTDRHVLVIEAEPADVMLVAASPEVIVEPEIIHWPADRLRMPADFIHAERSALTAPVPAGTSVVNVSVTGYGSPLPHTDVLLFLRGPGGLNRRIEATTDAGGNANFSFMPFWTASALVVIPADSFWTMVVRNPGADVAVNCPPLPATGPLGWWHEVLGQQIYDQSAGGGVRVGVIDTGVGPHPNLAHATDTGAFIDGLITAAPDGQDVDSHGSHVSGTIGARPLNSGEFAGIAPGVELFSARVFPPGQGANQGDIANAIDELSRTHQVDLINMSLGAPVPSEIERDAIIDALERGTLCVCAAANSNGPVEFPAAFPETVAVSALGLLGFAPPGSLSDTRLPLSASRFGLDSLFLANFSCFGPEIDCAGPGVAVIASVPVRHATAAPYAGMDGTSMASPAVCGALAVLLSRSNDYLALPRDETRSAEARRILRQSCRDIGMDADFQGRGVPTV
jgi:subtilisin